MQEEAQLRAKLKLEHQARSGANWFLFIAAFSLINSIVSHLGSSYGFIIGLGITQIIDAVAHEMGDIGKVIALLLDILAAVVFGLIGISARKRKHGAFIAGGILYGLDTLLYLAGKDFLGLAFHALALFGIFGGLKACRQLKEMEQPAIVVQPISNKPIG